MEGEGELVFLMDMTDEERKHHYLLEEIRYERATMESLMNEYKWWGQEIKQVNNDMALEFSKYRKQIKLDIKEQVRRIRWLTNQLSKC